MVLAPESEGWSEGGSQAESGGPQKAEGAGRFLKESTEGIISMPDLIYLSIAVLFVVACGALVRTIERL